MEVFEGRSSRQSAGCHRNNTTSGQGHCHGHGNANCNSHPRSDEVTQLGTALTMAAARSAAPYPAPASHPPAGQPMRNFLPRVAGLSRRGQAPPPKVKQLKTPLARPVPNKKASPHPQESPSLAVLGSANPSTSDSGETGELVAQIGLAHGQRRGEVHHSSFAYLSATDANAEVPRRSDDSYTHRGTNSRAESWSELSWDQGDVEALNDSYQLLNEMVAGTETARPNRKEASKKQLGPSVSSAAKNEHKKKTAPVNIHLKRKIETNMQAIINPVDRTEGGGPPTTPEPKSHKKSSKPTIKTNANAKATTATATTTNDEMMVDSSDTSSSYCTPCDSFRSISPSMQPCYCANKHSICGTKRKQNRQKDVTVSQVGFRHIEHVASVMQMPRVSARSQPIGIAHQYSIERRSFRDRLKPANSERNAGLGAASRAGPVGGVCRFSNANWVLGQLRPLVSAARAIKDSRQGQLDSFHIAAPAGIGIDRQSGHARTILPIFGLIALEDIVGIDGIDIVLLELRRNRNAVVGVLLEPQCHRNAVDEVLPESH
ncbi:uncharacterized protein LOC121404479 [Drosophila obscura]|uniref:uncharacterized protein LOC121404479 n=1 Tax=Drosophila obscura TaxID=7282 RepID=UPI001BB24FDA|nr:uncharacterized protein LOC121404479 [Drosophila obscura]